MLASKHVKGKYGAKENACRMLAESLGYKNSEASPYGLASHLAAEAARGMMT